MSVVSVPELSNGRISAVAVHVDQVLRIWVVVSASAVARSSVVLSRPYNPDSFPSSVGSCREVARVRSASSSLAHGLVGVSSSSEVEGVELVEVLSEGADSASVAGPVSGISLAFASIISAFLDHVSSVLGASNPAVPNNHCRQSYCQEQS